MGTVFDNHHPAALITLNIRYFIFDLNLFQLLLCFLDSFVKIRIKIADNRLVIDNAFSDFIKQVFEISCKIHINDAWEGLYHHSVDNFSKFSDI